LFAASVALAAEHAVYAIALTAQCSLYLLAGYGAWLDVTSRPVAAPRPAPSMIAAGTPAQRGGAGAGQRIANAWSPRPPRVDRRSHRARRLYVHRDELLRHRRLRCGGHAAQSVAVAHGDSQGTARVQFRSWPGAGSAPHRRRARGRRAADVRDGAV